MSHSAYDFLTESFLFDDQHIQNKYRRFQEQDITSELMAYRRHVLDNQPSLFEEITASNDNLSVHAESFGSFLPSIKLIKRSVLYLEKVVINDPIFELTAPRQHASEVMSDYLGFKSTSEVDREKLAEAARYMKTVTPMVVGNFIKFVPTSYMHEAPKEIPLYFSENNFADVLPPQLLEWFRDHAEVCGFTKMDGRWGHIEGSVLEPTRMISVGFTGNTFARSMVFNLMEMDELKVDEDKRQLSYRQFLPEEPPTQDHFDVWVAQSVNRAADIFYTGLAREVSFASSLGHNYLTHSQFTADLLNLDVSADQDIKTAVANLVLKLDLPVVEQVSPRRIMEVRHHDGEAFQNFRVELEKRLKELRHVNDSAELSRKLEDVAHELAVVEVHEVTKKLNQIRRNALGDATIFAASLYATIQSGGLTTLAAIAAAAKGVKTAQEYMSVMRESSTFFLWRLDRESKKSR